MMHFSRCRSGHQTNRRRTWRKSIQLLLLLIVGSIPLSHKNILAQTTAPGLFPVARRDYLVTNAQPNRLTTADVNLDGKPDLIASCGSNTPFQARVFKGTASSFEEAAVVPMFGSVIAGDFNHDSKLDVVSTEVGIALGNGDGTFQAPAAVATITGADCALSSDNIDVGDFNKDGNLDVVVAAPNGLNVLLGNGNGTFQTPPITLSLGGFEAVAVLTGDINQDSNPDLIAATKNTNRIYAILGAGNGTFQISSNFDTCQMRDITAADVNRDGRLDIAGVCNGLTNSLQMYFGQGNGTFGSLQAMNPSNVHPWSVRAADLNSDNNPDLVVIGGDATIGGQASILLGTGTTSFQTPLTYPLPSTLPQGLAIADFDASGSLDLAMGNRINGAVGGFFMILRGAENGTFAQPVSLGGVSDAEGVVTADFNKDGNTDLAAANFATNDVSIYLSNGNGAFAAAIPFGAGSGPSALTTGDFNKDGNLDLAVTDQVSSSIAILNGHGDGTFITPSFFLLTANFRPSSIVSGDFNNDGNTDLAVAGPGAIALFQGDGAGSFQAAGTITGTSSSSSPSLARFLNALTVGDFNKDGKLDIAALVYSLGDDNVRIYLGNADFTFTIGLSFRAGRDPAHIIAADFNKDAILDLATVSITDDTLTVFIGLGAGFFLRSEHTAGLMPSYIAAADLNKDGNVDIAAVNLQSSNVSVFYGNGLGTFAAANFYGTQGAYAIAVGDWNKDGTADIATVGSFAETTLIAQPATRKRRGQITSN
jgi:hypothetical protein